MHLSELPCCRKGPTQASHWLPHTTDLACSFAGRGQGGQRRLMCAALLAMSSRCFHAMCAEVDAAGGT